VIHYSAVELLLHLEVLGQIVEPRALSTHHHPAGQYEDREITGRYEPYDSKHQPQRQGSQDQPASPHGRLILLKPDLPLVPFHHVNHIRERLSPLEPGQVLQESLRTLMGITETRHVRSYRNTWQVPELA